MKIPERQAELDALIAEHFGRQEEESKPGTLSGGRPQSAPHLLTNAEIIQKASSAKNAAKFTRLWTGDISGYKSASEADLALSSMLAFWTGPDPARIEELFSMSALGQREKWVKRADYRQDTIDASLEGMHEFYKAPNYSGAFFGAGRLEKPSYGEEENRAMGREFMEIVHGNGRGEGHRNGDAGDRSPRRSLAGLGGRVKLGERIAGGVEPPEQLVEDVVYAGKLHAFNAEPSEGKTITALWVASEVMKRGLPVLYLDAENGPALIGDRLSEMGVDAEDLDRLLYYYPSPELGLDADSIANLVATAEEVGPGAAVFDSVPDFLALAGLNENDAGDVTRWILEVAQPLKDRGVAVLLLDHVTKSPEGRGRYARGSGAKLAKCDVVWSLKKTLPFDRERVGEIRLTLRKDREAFMPERVNFAAGGTPDGLMFRRADGVEEVTDPADGLTDSQRTALEALQVLGDLSPGEDGATYSEWKAEASLADTTFDRARDALLRLGLVRRIKNRYHPINPEPPLNPRGGNGGGGRRGGSLLEDGGATDPHSDAEHNRDTYAESTNPHEPPLNPHGGNGGSVQTGTPTNPHTPIRGGGGGGWTGGEGAELGVEEAAEEMRRSGSEPARALAEYLEGPSEPRLAYLTCVVLKACGRSSEGWRRHVAAVREAAGPVGVPQCPHGTGDSHSCDDCDIDARFGEAF